MISAIKKLVYFANRVTKPNSIPIYCNIDAILSELRRHFHEAFWSTPIEIMASLAGTRLPTVDHIVQMADNSDND